MLNEVTSADVPAIRFQTISQVRDDRVLSENSGLKIALQPAMFPDGIN